MSGSPTAAMAAPDARRRAFQELGAAQEAIMVKGLLEFRSRAEVPEPAKAVATAVICTISTVEDTEASEKPPANTWDDAQAALAKPGHFINSLSRFPFAVDAGRIHPATIAAARDTLGTVTHSDLAGDVVALHLYEWVCAAWRYCDVASHTVTRNSSAGELDRGGAAGTLHVRILCAHNLLNKDTGLFGDVSDPFVAVKVGNQEHKTPTIKNNLNPVWSDSNEFAFQLSGDETELHFQVWNSNTFRDASLGHATVALNSHMPTQWNRHMVALTDGGNADLEYEMYVERLLEPVRAPASAPATSSHRAHPPLPMGGRTAPSPTPAPAEAGAGANSHGGVAAHEVAAGTTRPAPRGSRAGVSASPANNVGQPGIVHVKVLRASNLTNRDTGLFGDKSDPFVVVKVGKLESKTPVIKNNLNPVWTSDNLFTFSLGAADHEIHIEVFNSNMIRNQSLGHTVVELRGLHHNQWHLVRERLEGGKEGELEFELCVDQEGGASAATPARPGRASIGSEGQSSVSSRPSRRGGAGAGTPASRVGGSPQPRPALGRPAARTALTAPGPRRSQGTASTSSSQPLSPNVRSQGGAPRSGFSGGYPSSRRSSAGGGVQDMKEQLREMQREIREMKAMEGSIKLGMRRDEERQRQAERKEDVRNVMTWRQEQKALALAHQAKVRREARQTELKESREYQENKRIFKHQDHEKDLHLLTDEYEKSKEHAEWHVELLKQTIPEQRRQVIEEHLEQYHLVAEYNLEEQQRERIEQREAQLAQEKEDMELALLAAKKDRDRALVSLEHARVSQPRDLRTNAHMSARPK